MKKLSKYLLMLLVLTAALALTGCTRGEVKPELVGTWMWNNDTRWVYVLNDDGTGTRGYYDEIYPIRWNVSGNTLRIIRQGDIPRGEITNERWTFTLTGDQLNLNSQQADFEYQYTRAGVLGDIDPALVDVWLWYDGPFWRYFFNSDGTGMRGWLDEEYSFRWGVVDNIIRMEFMEPSETFGFDNEWWEYRIEGDTLHIISRSIVGHGESHSYSRFTGFGQLSSEMFGIWEWDQLSDWAYFFFDDGVGVRGFSDQFNEFFWYTEGSTLNIIRGDGGIEAWQFEIVDGVLRLENFETGEIYYYNYAD